MARRWPDDEHDTIEAADPAALRAWFEQHHRSADGVWLKYWKKDSGRPSITWPEAVDVLLCFGWIDTKVQSIDADCYVQYVTRRRSGSVWSRINKDKVVLLESAGLMTDAGRAVIERAQADGSWKLLDAAEALIVPSDLAVAFARHPGSEDFYATLAPWAKQSVLRRIYLSKRATTRAKWVEVSAEHLAAERRPPF